MHSKSPIVNVAETSWNTFGEQARSVMQQSIVTDVIFLCGPGSSSGKALGLRARWPGFHPWCRRSEDFSSLLRVQTGSGVHSTSYKMSTVTENFPGGKGGRATLPLSSALQSMTGSSTRVPRAACGPRASFVRPGKGISQNTMRYEYWSLSH